MLDELAKVEIENFEAEYADQNWYKGKQQKEIAAMEKARKLGKLGRLHLLYGARLTDLSQSSPRISRSV